MNKVNTFILKSLNMSKRLRSDVLIKFFDVCYKCSNYKEKVRSKHIYHKIFMDLCVLVIKVSNTNN